MCDDHAERISVDWEFPSGIIRTREIAAKIIANQIIEYVKLARKPFNEIGMKVGKRHFKNNVGRDLRTKRARIIMKWSKRAFAF